METIKINAGVKDVIDRIIYYNKRKPSRTTHIEKDNSTSKNEIVELFQTCVSFDLCGGYILFEVLKDEGDMLEELEEYKSIVVSNIRTLKKFCKEEKAKNEIINYLKYNKLNWIINEINK